MAKFFSSGKEAVDAAGETDTVYVRESDFDPSLPNQWALDGYPSEELGEGWEVADQAILDEYAQ